MPDDIYNLKFKVSIDAQNVFNNLMKTIRDTTSKLSGLKPPEASNLGNMYVKLGHILEGHNKTLSSFANYIGNKMGGNISEEDRKLGKGSGTNVLKSIAGGIFGLLAASKPIQAIMTIISNIMQLAILPFALIIMELLLPLLIPVLKWLGSNMPEILKVTQLIVSVIQTVVGDYLKIWGVILGNISKFIEGTNNILNGVAKYLIGLFTISRDFFNGAMNIIGLFKEFINYILGLQWLNQLISAVESLPGEIASAVSNFISGGASGVGSDIMGGLQTVGGYIGLQSGGYVSNRGLAMLHPGEYVLPASSVNNNKPSINGGDNYTINVSVNTQGAIDERRLGDAIVRELERRRGIMKSW